MAILLDPTQKAAHIDRYWGEELFHDASPQTPSALSRSSSASLLDTVDPSKPWLRDFHAYLNSIARDFLSVMAASVSSERAFSSAGITISKRRNRLKADIVEALQCLKCMLKWGLLFREDPSIMTEVDEDSEKQQKVDGDLGDAWNSLVRGSDCKDECINSDDDLDVFVQTVDTL